MYQFKDTMQDTGAPSFNLDQFVDQLFDQQRDSQPGECE